MRLTWTEAVEERSAGSVCDDVPDDDEMSRDEAYRRESALVGDALPADNDGAGLMPPGPTPRTCGGTDHCGQTQAGYGSRPTHSAEDANFSCTLRS